MDLEAEVTATAEETHAAQAPSGLVPALPGGDVRTVGLPPSLKALAAIIVTASIASALMLMDPAAASAAAAAAPTGATATAASNPIAGLLSFVLHLDHHLSALIATRGQAVYAILFAIVFCETGLVLTPFLPGDSLLFAAGAFSGMGKLSAPILMAVFIVSAILGDAVNYAIGNKLGAVAISKGWIKKEYVEKTEKFYSKYGGKTVVLARFVPIIRTFAPFVAGVGSMKYSQFALYNVAGAVIWTVMFVGAGYFFGNLPFVQKNFTAVVLGIVAVSVVPVVWEVMEARREAQRGPDSSSK